MGRLTPRDHFEIVRLYKAGHSTKEITDQFGIGNSRLYQVLEARGCKPNRYKSRLPNLHGAAMYAMWQEGFKLVQVAKHFGVNEGTCRRRIRRHCKETGAIYKIPPRKLRDIGYYEDAETAVEYREAGLSLREVAHLLGVCTETIRRYERFVRLKRNAVKAADAVESETRMVA